MTSTDVYILSRDSSETARLNLQHNIYKETLGYLLHPKIQAKDGLRVADVATGTGVFLLDLAQSLSEVQNLQLVGFDISSEQFPPTADLPSNVELLTHSILDPFPQRFQGTFDVVHVRLVGQVFHSIEQKITAINNVVSLLQVGGWLQWEEPDHLIQAEVMTSAQDAEAPTLKALFDWSIRWQKDLEWDIETQFAMELRDMILLSENLRNVEEAVFPIDRNPKKEVRSMVAWNSLELFRAGLIYFTNSGRSDSVLGIGAPGSMQPDELLTRAKLEMENGAVYRYFVHSVTAERI